MQFTQYDPMYSQIPTITDDAIWWHQLWHNVAYLWRDPFDLYNFRPSFIDISLAIEKTKLKK